MLTILDDSFIKKLRFREDNQEIFIYIADLSYCKNNIKKYWAWLSFYEKAKAKKFYPDQLKEWYIKSHGTLRYILAHHVNCDPARIKFVYSKYCKPFIKESTIQFNMSHSGKIVAYTVSFERQVGIDIEYYDRNINIHELTDTAFTQSELDYFNNLNLDQQVNFFYDIWTIKEAVIKANGQGLFYPINTIEALSILKEQRKFVFTNEANARLKKWYCKLLKIHSDWTGAVVIESQQ